MRPSYAEIGKKLLMVDEFPKKEDRHLPRTWCNIKEIRIIDPDGWREDKKSWNSPLTENEFMSRAYKSTVENVISVLNWHEGVSKPLKEVKPEYDSLERMIDDTKKIKDEYWDRTVVDPIIMRLFENQIRIMEEIKKLRDNSYGTQNSF